VWITVSVPMSLRGRLRALGGNLTSPGGLVVKPTGGSDAGGKDILAPGGEFLMADGLGLLLPNVVWRER
jgi:hypothetical protein